MEMCLKIYSKNINKKIGKKHLKGKITKDKNHQIEFNYRKNNNQMLNKDTFNKFLEKLKKLIILLLKLKRHNHRIKNLTLNHCNSKVKIQIYLKNI